MTDLPTGTVTFLFTDIEGSTRLLQELGPDYGAVQRDHMRLMREAIAEGGGLEIRTEGDAFFAVFASAPGAVRAAVTAQRALAGHAWSHGRPIKVRMGLHTGEGLLGGDDYLGIDVNRAARIAAAGHGGQVLLSDVTRAVVAKELSAGVELKEMGKHRLKDFDEPQPIHQLVIEGLPAEFPPLKTLEIPSNLPAELTSFVGREAELEEIGRLLGSTRLLTLTGPGGTGKTRLAQRVAAGAVDNFPDGVFFVELAPINEPQLVPSAIASALGTGEEGPRPLLDTLRHELRDRTTLLVLDNFEQVIDAASSVATLLSAATRLRLLVTSRGPLRIQGEQEFPVPPLDLPDSDGQSAPDDLARYGAVALFLDRATAIDPRFTVSEEDARAVVEICRRLDGLPLAIELAASRVRLLSPEAILERLDRALPLLASASRDLPERQRTLRGAIAWSYDLLSPAMAGLFQRLCVFAGGFNLASAESVSDPDGELGVDPLDGIDALLDGGLVRRRSTPAGEVRFDLLQTVREYGLERLDDTPEGADVRGRHAMFFLQLAEAAESELRGPTVERHLGQLVLEHDNLRAALTWSIAHDEGDVGLRLVSALWRFWQFNGDLSAGRRWADQVLSLPSAAGRTAARANGLLAGGSLAYWQHDGPEALAAYEEALGIYQELEDPVGVADAMYNLAFVEPLRGNLDRAVELFQASHDAFEALGDSRRIADSLFGLSLMSRLRGNPERALVSAEKALGRHRQLQDFFGIAGSTYAMGRAASEMGDLDLGREHFMEILGIVEQLRERTGIALILDNMAHHALLQGNPRRGLRLAGASDATKEEVGGHAPPELIHLPDPREEARDLLTDEEIEAAWDEGRAMTMEQALAYLRQED